MYKHLVYVYLNSSFIKEIVCNGMKAFILFFAVCMVSFQKI